MLYTVYFTLLLKGMSIFQPDNLDIVGWMPGRYLCHISPEALLPQQEEEEDEGN